MHTFLVAKGLGDVSKGPGITYPIEELQSFVSLYDAVKAFKELLYSVVSDKSSWEHFAYYEGGKEYCRKQLLATNRKSDWIKKDFVHIYDNKVSVVNFVSLISQDKTQAVTICLISLPTDKDSKDKKSSTNKNRKYRQRG